MSTKYFPCICNILHCSALCLIYIYIPIFAFFYCKLLTAIKSTSYFQSFPSKTNMFTWNLSTSLWLPLVCRTLLMLAASCHRSLCCFFFFFINSPVTAHLSSVSAATIHLMCFHCSLPSFHNTLLSTSKLQFSVVWVSCATLKLWFWAWMRSHKMLNHLSPLESPSGNFPTTSAGDFYSSVHICLCSVKLICITLFRPRMGTCAKCGQSMESINNNESS